MKPSLTTAGARVAQQACLREQRDALREHAAERFERIGRRAELRAQRVEFRADPRIAAAERVQLVDERMRRVRLA